MKRLIITGMTFKGSVLEWTRLRPGKGGAEVLGGSRVVLDAEGDPLEQSELTAAHIRHRCADLKGNIALGVSSDQLLMRVVELPSTDPSEIRGMIELQMDKVSPFPVDTMSVSHEILRKGDTSSLVFMAAMQKERVEKLGLLFFKAGLGLHRLDAEAMAWWRLLSDKQEIVPRDRQWILIFDQGSVLAILVQHGVPLSFKPLHTGEDPGEEAVAAEAVKELASLMLSVDLEQGPAPMAAVDIWCRDEKTEAWQTCLGCEFSCPIRVKLLDSLPALCEGIARRSMAAGKSGERDGAPPGVLDFVPDSWRLTSSSKTLRRRLMAASAWFLGVWLAGTLVFAAGYGLKVKRVARLEARATSLQKPDDDMRQLRERVKALEQYLNRQETALEYLREVSDLIPKDVDLTSFQHKKNKQVVLRGEALSVNPIYDFKLALDKSSLFKGVEMGSIQPNKRRDVTAQTFTMTCKIGEAKK
ncbi:MAG: PilN domain-containing protein [Lentisphaerae bacterium]|nr:PilN domain-containing protein [Lentisphaerota bacterium]